MRRYISKLKKTGKTSAKNLNIATKKHEKIQSKTRQQSDGVISFAGNKQRSWNAARKNFDSKKNCLMYFNSINL